MDISVVAGGWQMTQASIESGPAPLVVSSRCPCCRWMKTLTVDEC